jgi:hypothetical protein
MIQAIFGLIHVMNMMYSKVKAITSLNSTIEIIDQGNKDVA